MENLETFLSLFNWKIEFNNLKIPLKKEIAINRKDQNIYFLAGVNDLQKRNGDNDIVEKNYFYLDFDIRENVLKNENRIITDTELEEKIAFILEILEKNDKYKEWSALVNSWNWLHVYYRNNENIKIDIKKYKDGVSEIIKTLNETINDKNLLADGACCNIWRIARLPFSFNLKRKEKYNLENKQVKLYWIEKRNSRLVLEINSIAEQVEKEKKIKEQIKTSEQNKENDEVMEKILKLDLYEMIKNDFWFIPAGDGKNFLHDCRKWNQWLFIFQKDGYYYLHNQGSHFLTEKWFEKDKNYNVFWYVRKLNNFNNQETFKYFEDNFWIKKEKQTEKIIKLSDLLFTPNEKKDNEKRYTWGTENLNKNFWIIRGWSYIVLVGETWWGKTTFALNQALRNTELWHTVLYLSLEMDTNELVNNLARKYACYEIEEEFKKSIPDSKKYAFDKKRTEILENKKLKIAWMKKGSDLTIKQIEEMIKNHNEKIDLLYLDNFDLIEMIGREDELTKQRKISKSIMKMASYLNIPVVVLHHYRKKWTAQGKNNQRTMDDIWGNRKITHDADFVLQLSRAKWEDLTKEEKAKTSLWLAKARWYDSSFSEVYFYKWHFYDYFPNF